MIITFITDGFNTVSDDYSVIYDNCSELRTKPLDTEEKFDKAKKILEELQNSNDYIVKCWVRPSGGSVFEQSDFNKKAHLIQFQSKGKFYYIITLTKVYVANDENKTFLIIN